MKLSNADREYYERQARNLVKKHGYKIALRVAEEQRRNSSPGTYSFADWNQIIYALQRFATVGPLHRNPRKKRINPSAARKAQAAHYGRNPLSAGKRTGTRTTVSKKNAYGEFVVRLYIDGKHYKPADYFTNDKRDAIDTARAMKIRVFKT